MQKISKLVIAILILAAIILAAPFGMGIIAEKEAHKKVKEIQVKLEEYPNIEYKLTSYKRGFFKSKAEELIILKNLKFDGKEIGPIELILSDEILHGPLIINRSKTGKVNLWVGRAVLKSKLVKVIGFNINPLPLDFYVGRLGFGGDIKLSMDMPKFILELPNFSVALENIKDEFEISNDFKKIINQFEFKNAIVADKIKSQKIEIKGFDVSADVSKNDQGFWLGSRRIQAEFIAVNLDGKVYTLKGFYSKVRDIERDGQLSSELMLNIRTVGIDEKLYGPHRLTLEVDGIDASLLSKLNKTMMEISHEHLASNAEGAQQSQLTEAARDHIIMKKAADLAADLIKKGFVINVKNLEIATPWGKLMANSRISVPDLSKNQKAISQLSLFSSILNIDATLNAQIPSQLIKSMIETRYRRMMGIQPPTSPLAGIERAAPQSVPQSMNVHELAGKHLAKLVADGWFVPKGDLLDISLSFKKGVFLVNNKPLKPQGILPELPLPAAANAPIQKDNAATAAQPSEVVPPSVPVVPVPMEFNTQQPGAENRPGSYPEMKSEPGQEIKEESNSNSAAAPSLKPEAEPEKGKGGADIQGSPLAQPGDSSVSGANQNQPAAGSVNVVPKMDSVVNPSDKDNVSPAEKNTHPAPASTPAAASEGVGA